MTDASSRSLPGRHWIEAWFDSPLAVPILLTLFVVVWTLFQTISFLPASLHPDVVEVYGWGQHPAAGYYKHPPLGGLMTGAWFAVFPAADWAAQLLAMTNAALSLFFVDLIARRYLSGDKRLLVLLLLMLTPFYQFHSVRFASNQTLLPTWPLAVYCFIRAYESRAALWGAAAGASAALAMLGKYFSVYLIGGLVIAALVHPDRMRYLRSWSPWASIAAGLALLAPHLVWLEQTGFRPFSYAYVVHGGRSPFEALLSVPGYLAGSVGYVAVALIVYALIVRPRPGDVVAALWPRDPDRRMLAVLLWAPLLLPAVTAPLLDLALTSLWTMQGWFVLPILLLMPERVALRRTAAVHVAAGVAVIALVALLASPVLAYVKHMQGAGQSREYYEPLADELSRRWHALTPRPLRIVMGDQDFALAMSFYAPDHPDSVPAFDVSASPWVTPARIESEGFAVICRDASCAQRAVQLAKDRDVRQQDIEVVRWFFGSATAPERFTLVLVPPRP
jgi:4-amino-4-deoxy-L-arabinose transferase-like glycosyltransferase